MLSFRYPRLLLILAATTLMLAIAGCGGGGGGSSSDGAAPTITNARPSPTVAPTSDGGNISILADVTDADGIQAVWASVTRPDGTEDPRPVSMNGSNGSTYGGVYLAAGNGGGQPTTYSVTVHATDNAGRTASSTPFTFQVPAVGPVVDKTPPSIANMSVVTPSGWSFEGGDVTIRADVTDAGGVKQVTARVRRPDGVWDSKSVAMALGAGKTYTGVYAVPVNSHSDDQPQTYGVAIVASDIAGNSATSATITFEVPGWDLPDPPAAAARARLAR